MKAKLILIGVAFFVVLVTTLSGVVTVNSGEVAVVTNFGRVTGRVLEPGAHLITPFVEGTLTYNTKKVTYETALEEKQKESKADYRDFPVDTNTQDGQPVDIAYTVRFSVDPTKASWVAQNIGGQEALVEKIVKTESRIWARNIPRRFDAETLYTGAGSQKVQEAIFEELKTTFTNNGLILDTVGIRELYFSPEYVNAIKSKQVAAVQVETEKNIAAQAEYKKQATITAAEASAKEQALQRETISDQLLKKLWIERWNGTLPVTMLGSDANTLIQLPK